MGDETKQTEPVLIYNIQEKCMKWYWRGKWYDSLDDVPTDDKQKPFLDKGKRVVEWPKR